MTGRARPRRTRVTALLVMLAGFAMGAALALAAAEGERDYLAGVVVHEHESPDPRNRFFDLAVANDRNSGEVNGGVPHIGIITEKDSRLANWLAAHQGKRIALSLTAGDPLTRDGEAIDIAAWRPSFTSLDPSRQAATTPSQGNGRRATTVLPRGDSREGR